MPEVPAIVPARLARIPEPFDHPDWLFELKYDGFRALAYIDGGECRLVSRNGNRFRGFEDLCAALASAAGVRQAVLDGEIACVDASGRPRFDVLLYRRSRPSYFAFDIPVLNGRDLRDFPLTERKRRLRRAVPGWPAPLVYVDHVEGSGVALFNMVCAEDLEGVVAKWKHGPYGTEPPSWIKIKNPRYSQTAGRHERFERMRTRQSTMRS